MNDGFHRRSYSCFHRCFGLYFFNCFFLSTEDFEWPHLNGASDDNALVICRGIQSHVMQGFPLTASITQLIFTTSNVKKNQFLFFDQTFFFFSFVTFLMTGPLWAPVILKIFFWTVIETCQKLTRNCTLCKWNMQARWNINYCHSIIFKTFAIFKANVTS